MKEFIKLIEEKIKSNLEIEKIKIVDNSHLHKGHKFFNENKFHLKLEIKSNQLNALSKLEAQRKIMGILKEDLKNKIHALEIKII
tara:strand:- start:6130 stop:6384 length:255 start_codon:yes stop_codon:yes gene_type:complete